MATLEDARIKLASQKDVGGNDYLDLRPAILLCPMGLGGTARVLNAAEYDPDTANKLQRPNMVRGLLSDIVDTPRLTGTRHYLFASPSEAPVLEVAFLQGNQSPVLEQDTGFTVDGARFKVRLDFGVAAIGIARQYWRAWIETLSPRQRVRLELASPASIGGRGLKPAGRASARSPRRASPASIGGRGLKQLGAPLCSNAAMHRPPVLAGVD